MFTAKKRVSVVLALMLLFTSVSATMAQGAMPPQDQPIVSSYLKAQANPQLSDGDKIKNVIDAYFKSRYEGQKRLELQDFDPLLSSKTQKWVQKEKDKREIELYLAKLYKLNYMDYHYVLDYDKVEIMGSTATVHLYESHEVVFEAMAPEVSEMGGLEHSITLIRTGKGWMIVEDAYKDELSEFMEVKSKEKIIEQVQNNYKAELQQKAAASGGGKVLLRPAQAWHAYNRTAAVQYADQWALGRNPAYQSFDNNGGDCTNFASQVIRAGGAAYDYSGPSAWYPTTWYPYSDSWIYVHGLFDYLTVVLLKLVPPAAIAESHAPSRAGAG
jgi:hypothetical protein